MWQEVGYEGLIEVMKQSERWNILLRSLLGANG